jgi:hypothetical protein
MFGEAEVVFARVAERQTKHQTVAPASRKGCSCVFEPREAKAKQTCDEISRSFQRLAQVLAMAMAVAVSQK